MISYEIEMELKIVFPAGGGPPEVQITTPENGTKVWVGKDVEFVAKVLNGGPGEWDLAWEVDGEIVADGVNVTLVFDTKGPHTVRVVASDGNGEVEDSIIVEAKPKKSKGDAPSFDIAVVLMAFVMALGVLGLARRRK